MKTVCACVTGLALSASAFADVVSTVSIADNTLYQDATDRQATGAGPNFFAGKNNQASIRRGVLLFPVGPGMGVPAGSTITGATLTLSMSQSNAASAAVSLHQMFNSWGEGTSSGSGNGAPSTTNDATWVHRYFNFATWNTPGGDFAATPLATTTVGGVGVYNWSSPGLTALVQAWLDLPIGNFGLLVKGDEAANGSAMRFDSRENPAAALRPTLTITYSVPGPGAIGLGAAAGMAVLRRRRK